MKGRISKDVLKMLDDKTARDELRVVLVRGRKGTVRTADKTFNVRPEREHLEEETAVAVAAH